METIAFKQEAEGKFKLSFLAGRQEDGRGEGVEVKTRTIFEGIVYQVVKGERSLLKLDHWMRTDEAQNALGRGKKKGLVMSDTVMLEALGSWKMDVLRETALSVYRILRGDGRLTVTLPTGRVVRPAVADGSCFGGHWATALACLGEGITCGIDIEEYKTRGDELKASRRLMGRVVNVLGKGFATHLLYDALAGDRPDFAMGIEEWGTHLVVKTEEKVLWPIVYAEEAFEATKTRRDAEELKVEVAEGVDAGRGIRYEVRVVRGVTWEGLKYPLAVARVTEEHLKGKYKGQTFVYWVLTTDETLTAVELRELSHARWRIETNLFKELNELVGSKRAYIKDKKAKSALLLIWFIGWSMLQWIRVAMKKRIDRLSAGAKQTKGWLQKVISVGDLRSGVQTT